MNSAIILKKGEKINLSKHDAIDLKKGGNGLNKVCVGLGWDPANSYGGLTGLFKSLIGMDSNIDCDAFAALSTADNEILEESDIVYFHHLLTPDGSMTHTGDNLTGDGDGDDEQIIVNLTKIRPEIKKVVVGVNIYKGRERNQHFGMLRNAFIRIVDMNTNKELCNFKLDDHYSGYTTLFFGELELVTGEWLFTATGVPVKAQSIGEALSPFLQ